MPFFNQPYDFVAHNPAGYDDQRDVAINRNTGNRTEGGSITHNPVPPTPESADNDQYTSVEEDAKEVERKKVLAAKKAATIDKILKQMRMNEIMRSELAEAEFGTKARPGIKWQDSGDNNNLKDAQRDMNASKQLERSKGGPNAFTVDKLDSVIQNPGGSGTSSDFINPKSSVEDGTTNTLTAHDDLQADQGPTLLKGKSLFLAVNALIHARAHEIEIRTILEDMNIHKSTISAGFNEIVIAQGGGRVEEIQVRINTIDAPASDVNLQVLSESLGKIFSPFLGSLYIGDANAIPTLVFKDNGDVWDFNQFILDHLQQQKNEGSTGNSVLISAFTTSTPNEGHINAGGVSEGTTSDESSSGAEGFEKDHNSPSDQDDNNASGNEGNDNPGDGDDDDPIEHGNDGELQHPEISFDLFAFISNSVVKYEEELELAELSTFVGFRLWIEENRKFVIDFTRLGFQQATEPDGAPHRFRMSHALLCVDSKYKEVKIDIERVHSTSESRREIQTTESTGKERSHKISAKAEGGIRGVPTGMASAGYEYQRGTASNSTKERTINTSPVHVKRRRGLVSYNFSVDDALDQVNGVEYTGNKLPKALFTFPNSLIFKRVPNFEVTTKTFWNILQPRTDKIAFSNVCHEGTLEVPYRITESTHRFAEQYVWKNDESCAPEDEDWRRAGNAEVKLTPSVKFQEKSFDQTTAKEESVESTSMVQRMARLMNILRKSKSNDQNVHS